MNSTQLPLLYNAKLSGKGDSFMAAVAKDKFGTAVSPRVYAALGVETDELLKLISDSATALAEMRDKFAAST